MNKQKLLLSTALTTLLAAIPGRASVADYATEVLAQNPLTYWRFNETLTPPPTLLATNLGSLGTAGDGNYLTLLPHPSPGALAGSSDAAAAFNGVDTRVEIPYNAAFNPSGAFSVEFWAMITNDVATIAPLQSRGSGAANGYLFFANNGGDRKWWFRTYTGTTRGNVVSTNNITIGQWTHVVGVRDSSGANHLYINGVEAAPPTAGAGYTAQTTSPMYIGAGANEGAAGNWYWPGLIDEVAFYGAALSAAQVAAHYQNATNATPPQSYDSLVIADGAVGYWRLDEPSYPAQVASNLGSLGAYADGSYRAGLIPSASDLAPPAFPGLDAGNKHLQFDGTNDMVLFGATNVPLPWTAVFWVKRQDAVGASAVLLNSAATGIKLEQWGSTTRSLGFTAYGVADYYFNYTAPVDTWVQLALVGTADGTALYVNGALQESSTDKIAMPLLRLGNLVDPPKAAVDEIATFGRPLLEGQIKTLYLTAIGDTNAPAFVNNIPIVSPSGTIYATTPFTLNIDVYGAGPLSYQWRKDGVTVGTDATYAIASASLTDNGSYDVVVTNAYGTVTSGTVAITVNPAQPPVITNQPVARSVYAGGTARFTVGASGTAPLTYQWKKNNTNIAGATNQVLVITNVGTADATSYSVGVTNVAGGVVSASVALTLRTPAGSYEQTVVSSGPVAYWRLGESSGTTAFDYAGGHDGSYSNVVLGLPGFSSADQDTSAGFDPTQYSQVIVTDAADLNFTGSTPAFTLEVWAKFNDLTGIQRLFANGQPGNYGLGYGINTATGLRFTTYGVQDFDLDLPTPLEIDTWYHIVGVASGGSFYFYLNGQQLGVIAFTGAARSSSLPFQLGNNPAGAQELVNGQMDEAAVYRRALTAEEIATHYAVGQSGTSPVKLTIQRSGSDIIISWPAGTLESADALAGAQWAPVQGAAAPSYTVQGPVTGTKFYRVKVQ